MRSPIDDIEGYAAIGDGRTVALVSREGSIDWLCWPRPDSPSIFGALLDPSRGGFWRIAPVPESSVTRRYVPDTNVLETTFDTGRGRLVVTDLMPVMDEEEKERTFVPEYEIVRLVECERGEVEVAMTFMPRPGYGLESVSLDDAGWLGLRMGANRGLLMLRSEAPWSLVDATAISHVRLRAGESIHASLSWTAQAPAVIPPLGAATRAAIARTVAWWRRWAARAKYDGHARELVVRSALVLKLLTYPPSGAILAAATTSLPERNGGDLNWDYRYCWLRDASLTVRALAGLGYFEEAEDFVEWLIHTHHRRARVRIVYDVFGNPIPRERELGALSGYRDSRPVRVGNGARGQRQLDVYGEVVDAAASLLRAGIPLDRETKRLLVAFGQQVVKQWRKPDQGLWEPREAPRLHTHSLLLCWVALDRLLDLARKGHLRVPVDSFERERAAIRAMIEHFGFNDRLGAYTGAIGGDDLDAAALLIPWYGFERASSPRMRSTFRALDRALATGPLLHRYSRDLSPGEGAFGICSFWAAEYLALGGASPEEARARFDAITAYANDVGLFAEEIDPDTGAHLGNFPQAFTHIGLVNAALSLERRKAGEKDRSTDAVPEAAQLETEQEAT